MLKLITVLYSLRYPCSLVALGDLDSNWSSITKSTTVVLFFCNHYELLVSPRGTIHIISAWKFNLPKPIYKLNKYFLKSTTILERTYLMYYLFYQFVGHVSMLYPWKCSYWNVFLIIWSFRAWPPAGVKRQNHQKKKLAPGFSAAPTKAML